MLVLKINDVKNFMNQLLIGQTFDDFSLVDASITTFCSFMIDGTLHRDFFDSDSKQPSVQSALYCPWKELILYYSRQASASAFSNYISVKSLSVNADSSCIFRCDH